MIGEIFYIAMLYLPSTCSTGGLKPFNFSNPVVNDFSWRVKMLLVNNYRRKQMEAKDSTIIQHHGRKVGLEQLVEKFEEPCDIKDDEALQRKLFQLMYETVRECETKAQRAELIKKHYVKDAAFEIGYVLGDVTDKYNFVVDVASSLKLMEDTPIELMTAYEQISTQAIEINHLVDFVVNDKKFKPISNLDSTV